MTVPDIVLHPQLNKFEEGIDIAIEELELAIRWDRPSALLFVYDSESVRAKAEKALKNYLNEHRQMIVHLQVDEIQDFDLIRY